MKTNKKKQSTNKYESKSETQKAQVFMKNMDVNFRCNKHLEMTQMIRYSYHI